MSELGTHCGKTASMAGCESTRVRLLHMEASIHIKY